MPTEPHTTPPRESAPEWKNWSENIEHSPPTGGGNYYFTPRNLAELKSIIADAAVKGVTVRVSGQRHSQPPLVIDDNRGAPSAKPQTFLIDLSCYADLGPAGDQRMVVDAKNKKITVNCGVREDELDASLTAHNLILQTVTAGGFFSVGGMTAVDVHGATIEAPIFAETASAFTIVGADGSVITIDEKSPAVEGHSPLEFARVSLGGLGVVTSVTLDVLARPWATSLQGGHESFGPRVISFRPQSVKDAFIQKMPPLLAAHDRVETFFNPYADNVLTSSFLALYWDLVDAPEPQTPNALTHPEGACALAAKDEFGAPMIGGFEGAVALPAALEAQRADLPVLAYGLNQLSVSTIKSQVEAANKSHSELWLSEATRVMFMSYFVPLPDLGKAGMEKAWQGLEVVANYVTANGNFHVAAPMEFRFVKGGSSALSGTFTHYPGTYFINLDLIGWVADGAAPADYPPELLKFFALVERKWVELDGLPHNGKMYGFYDPSDADPNSSTAPFNAKFLKYITGLRHSVHGAPVYAFKAYREARDPDGRFYNGYLRALLGD